MRLHRRLKKLSKMVGESSTGVIGGGERKRTAAEVSKAD
jgi:hypothetical protein